MNLRYQLLAVLLATTLSAQAGVTVAPLPADVIALPSIEQVLSRLGVKATEYSTHLQLDAPDIAAPGEIQVSATSRLPGTTRLLLFRGGVGAPAPVAPVKASVPPAQKRTTQPTAPALPTPALLASWAPQDDAAPYVEVRYEVYAKQWVTLLAQAQGRWFIVAREIKVGTRAASAAAGVMP